MPIQISGLPADILPEVKSMKNKKRIIAAVFTAAAIVTGFMRWNFFIKPKPVTDIRFWQEYDGEITCTIGSEFYSTDVDPEEFIDIVAEIKTGEKVTIDTADYTQASRNYKIGFHADHWQDYLTVRFYDDFKYVAFLEELVFKSHIPGPTDMYILENPDYIKSVFDDRCLYHYLLRKNSAATSGLNVHKIYDPINVTKKILGELHSMPELYHIMEERLVRQLINLQVISDKKQIILVKECRKQGRDQLKTKMPQIMKSSLFSKKIKIMSLLACKIPFMYRGIYLLYSKLTGIDKKYAVE